MDYFVQLVTVLAWPATVLVIAFLFRSQLRQAAVRLSSFSYKDFKAEFRQDLNKVEEELQSLPKLQPPPLPERSSALALSSDHERLQHLVDISPRAAIMEAWYNIEVTTKRVTDAYGVAISGQIAGKHAIHELIGLKLLPPTSANIYEQLRRMRARAAHASDFAVGPKEAERYIDTAHQFYVALLFVLSQAQSSSPAPKAIELQHSQSGT